MTEIGAKVAGTVTYTASGSVMIFGWLLSDISMATAAIVAVLGFLATQYFNFKKHKLEVEKLAFLKTQATANNQGEQK